MENHTNKTDLINRYVSKCNLENKYVENANYYLNNINNIKDINIDLFNDIVNDIKVIGNDNVEILGIEILDEDRIYINYINMETLGCYSKHISNIKDKYNKYLSEVNNK